MRILLLVHSFNSLSQRIFVELEAMGIEVSIEFDINDSTLVDAVKMFSPDIIIAPFLKRAIPEEIWQNHLCLIVHPGIMGDKGPSSLDWAILKGCEEWGVTVLQANAQMDGGSVWATQNFPMRPATKSSLYRNEVSDGAVIAVKKAMQDFQNGKTERLGTAGTKGGWQPLMRQEDRAIDWENDTTRDILRKIRCADGMPGVRDEILGQRIFLYDAHQALDLSGVPGTLLATSGMAVCRATSDGAIWIGHMRRPKSSHPFKLPATMVLDELLPDLPDVPLDSVGGYQEIEYRQDHSIGYLRFNFYNGAMSTAQCQRLLCAYRKALQEDTRIIVLEGGDNFWSNGIHLNMIEASSSAAEESWDNINAMDDLAEAIIRTDTHLTIAAMSANAGAGGAFLARACDYVWLRQSVVLNPHYKDMGNLYGSEFWTYLLPRYAGTEKAKYISEQRLPMSAQEAVQTKFADASFGKNFQAFHAEVTDRAFVMAEDQNFSSLLAEKNKQRQRDEAEKPLQLYRTSELEKMRQNFFGFDPSYHVARYNFVYKVLKSRTPLTLARHRDKRHLYQGKKVS